MASLNAFYRPDPFDLFASPVECVLTDEHAASSYGLPVVVLAGVPHGPAELPGELEVRPEPTPEYAEFLAGERWMTRDWRERQKWTVESYAMVIAARRAGYRVTTEI